MLNEHLILIVFIVCTGILNKFIFKDYLFWIFDSKISIFTRILLVLISIPITFIGLGAWPLWYFINIEPASLGWGFLFTGFFYLLAIELLFLPSTKFRVLYVMLIILPFLIAYPKSLKNNSCIREAPLNQILDVWNTRTGIWKGRTVRFETAQDRHYRYPKLYNIYDLKINKLLESNIEIEDLNGKNNCAGFEFQTRVSTIDAKGYGTLPACLGVPIQKCDIDEDYASKTNVYYISQ